MLASSWCCFSELGWRWAQTHTCTQNQGLGLEGGEGRWEGREWGFKVLTAKVRETGNWRNLKMFTQHNKHLLKLQITIKMSVLQVNCIITKLRRTSECTHTKSQVQGGLTQGRFRQGFHSRQRYIHVLKVCSSMLCVNGKYKLLFPEQNWTSVCYRQPGN